MDIRDFDQLQGNPSLSVLVIARDHEQFIADLGNSIHREFPEGTPIMVVDVGSIDGTVKQIHNIFGDLNLNYQIIEIHREGVPLDAIGAASEALSSEYVCAISGDDVFGEKYFVGATESITSSENPIVVNFPLRLVDSNLQQFDSQVPKWKFSKSANRRSLLLGNPGTAPGVVIPWKLLLSLNEWKSRPRTLVDDYWLWWTLQEHSEFMVARNGDVLYRRHGANLTASLTNLDYIESLGFSVGLAWTQTRSALEKSMVLFLFIRWLRHVPFRYWRIYNSGFRRSTLRTTRIKV